MATVWEGAAYSFYRYVLFAYSLIVILVISHFGFEGRTLVLIVSVPVHSLSFTLHYNSYCNVYKYTLNL